MHNFNTLPITGRNVLVSSAYAAGTTVVDFTDPARPLEVGHHDPHGANTWSAYWYNGHIYTNDGGRGVDVMLLSDERARGREEAATFEPADAGLRCCGSRHPRARCDSPTYNTGRGGGGVSRLRKIPREGTCRSASPRSARRSFACAVLPSYVSAHPHELGEVYVPWADKLSERQWLMTEPSTALRRAARGRRPPAPSGLSLVGNADKDGTTNSDLAFWGNYAYAGNYGGFRILDVSSDQPDHGRRQGLQRPAERRLRARDGRQAVPVPVDRHGADGRGLHERERADRQRRPRRLRGRARVRRHRPGQPAVHRHDPDGVRLAHALDHPRRRAGLHLRRLVSARVRTSRRPARRRRTPTTGRARSRTRRSRSSRSPRRAGTSSSSSRSRR